jgi:hypothetical protein
MGGRTERIEIQRPEKTDPKKLVNGQEESLKETESRQYIYGFSLCPPVSVDIFCMEFRINQR